MEKYKKIPNPYGKLGGPEHRKKVIEVTEEIIERKKSFVIEFFVKIFGRKKGRFVDVAAFEEEKLVEFHQVGKKTKKGFPVKRERDVMEELEKEYKIKPDFHAYNNEKIDEK